MIGALILLAVLAVAVLVLAFAVLVLIDRANRWMPAPQGPAHLDVAHGIAHKNPACLDQSVGFTTKSITASDGYMQGFVWCRHCGHQPFVEREDV